MTEGNPIVHHRWRQVDKHEDAPPEKVELTIPQPVVVEQYYKANGLIDSHNCCRTDDLMIDQKIGVHEWSTRVNLSICSMCVVDSWRLFHL